MKNETILIFGDSYSTFKDYVPQGYSVYYPKSGEGLVSDVSQTWWDMLVKETQSKIRLHPSFRHRKD